MQREEKVERTLSDGGGASGPEKCRTRTMSNSTLADCIFQDGGNISHPTSSSRTFHSPTKNWSLIPLPVNLSRLMTHLLPMEYSGSDTAMLLKLRGKSCRAVEHSSWSPAPPCCEKAQRSPGTETTRSGSESMERKRCQLAPTCSTPAPI